MKKLAIVGCGKLGKIVADAVINGTLKDYTLTGVYSRTASKAEAIAESINDNGGDCKVCISIDELLSLKPDFVVEAASPAAMKELALPALRGGASVVTLSIGAFADDPQKQVVKVDISGFECRQFRYPQTGSIE